MPTPISDLDGGNTTPRLMTFASGSGGAAGATTTIIDFACPNKGETLHDGLRLWHKKADGKCACDYGFHMTIDDWNRTIERRSTICTFRGYLLSRCT